MRKWDEGAWIDFIFRFGLPAYLLVLGGLTLWAIRVLIEMIL